MLYGAIIGDIAGSIYEFDNIHTKPEELFPEEAFFTDDTVMTVAVAQALQNGYDYSLAMRVWGSAFPNRGYGGNFAVWLADPTMGAYNSFGNGSAMRTSAVAWVAKNVEEVLELSKKVAEVTHNHPEGIKGAQATACAIWMARMGHPKRGIKRCIEETFGYDLSRTCDEIRPTYYFNETCQETVPEAITAFLESTDFEDSIKLAISLGGDSDTLAAITGSIAEAYYGVPTHMIVKARSYLPQIILKTIDEFEDTYRYGGSDDEIG